jgi:SAM-dependent MidA family methyltransferase
MAGHRGEWSPWLAPWARSLADGLAWGELVIADYGYERVELDHPDRHQGTLTAHHRHRRIDDWPTWLAHAGDMDLTAHVDFSELADVLSDGGLHLCLQTQAAWLIDQGLIEEAQQRLFGQEMPAGADPSMQDQSARHQPAQGQSGQERSNTPEKPESIRMLGQLQILLSDADMGQRFLVLTASRGLEEAN